MRNIIILLFVLQSLGCTFYRVPLQIENVSEVEGFEKFISENGFKDKEGSGILLINSNIQPINDEVNNPLNPAFLYVSILPPPGMPTEFGNETPIFSLSYNKQTGSFSGCSILIYKGDHPYTLPGRFEQHQARNRYRPTRLGDSYEFNLSAGKSHYLGLLTRDEKYRLKLDYKDTSGLEDCKNTFLKAGFTFEKYPLTPIKKVTVTKP
ncbi:hypothetical protein EHQ12_19090 [Leptospira gomenensis]|uniref:Uncharacterized protein n=1 Tax=Leptospira gomenensis TaxID=2484974 RepID=A0A5F1YC32_9LEPT|nr:hypothetical protein [Leptospira gomenensis]TGK32405.1 hypothetical protein EHQ12_19090 [Leptospira gomenensis]TGK34698.1 hypothetical protein EHQ17_09840 [Leptospira gomenensis]TGK51005.1 hypothetical protein EHQ07_03875 [Leptospira gomenensis]TGK68354.1 hypothetical protein EHQ13_01020 [Leptospira gomenensis]